MSADGVAVLVQRSYECVWNAWDDEALRRSIG